MVSQDAHAAATLCYILGEGAKSAGIALADKEGDVLALAIREHFSDATPRPADALAPLNERLWADLDAALRVKGGGVLGSLWALFTGGEGGLGREVRRMINRMHLPLGHDGNSFRKACQAQVKQAREEKLLGLRFGEAAAGAAAGELAGLPEDGFDAALSRLGNLAIVSLERADLPDLGYLLSSPTSTGRELYLLLLDREFGAYARQSGAAVTKAVFDRYEKLLLDPNRTDEKIDRLLGMERQRHEARRAVYTELIDLLRVKGLFQKALSRQHVGTVEKQSIADLERRVNETAQLGRGGFPALLHGLGKLLFAADELEKAGQLFAEVADAFAQDVERAEARYNLSLAALLRGRFEEALPLLKQAATVLPARQPFPFDRYAPVRILGVSSFLCRDTKRDKQVIIKTTDATPPAIDHPSAAVMAREVHETRAYQVRDYDETQTLAELVRATPPTGERRLSPREVAELAVPLAEALRDIYARHKTHHHALKPTNLLVRRDGEGWHFRLTDFAAAQPAPIGAPKSAERVVPANYAAPEQLGQVEASLGAYTDVYGFGRLCCFALFGELAPDGADWASLGDQHERALGRILTRCVKFPPADRYADFDAVLADLRPVLAGLRRSPPVEIKIEDVPEAAAIPVPKTKRSSHPRHRTLWAFAPVSDEGKQLARQRLAQFREQGPGAVVSDTVRAFWGAMKAVSSPGGQTFRVIAACVAPVAGTRADNYPVPGAAPEVSLEVWLNRHGGPPDWAGAKRLLACYGLRLPTLGELRAALDAHVIDHPTAPAWVREDRTRVRLLSGEMGYAPTGEPRRWLVGVRGDVQAEAPMPAPPAPPTPPEPPPAAPELEPLDLGLDLMPIEEASSPAPPPQAAPEPKPADLGSTDDEILEL